MANCSFKQEHDFEKRRSEALRIREKYPDRIPHISTSVEDSLIGRLKSLAKLPTKGFWPPEVNYKKLKTTIRRLVVVEIKRILIVVVKGAVMSTIYEEKKDEDGFLYVTYSGENTFGQQIVV
ncbi:hypothetical protein HPP92_014042 [Vanilla planifolia]|uniref:Autophagy-related protein n=1 Tax=Vanilla planifolia TaxID=51239 RepID=A0A835UWI1_VANPL|nr:hypothetical protein HPP92_014042 [Vanilla planifolia]